MTEASVPTPEAADRVFEWRETFSGRARLHVEQGAPGPVRVEGWDRDEVHVKAVKDVRGPVGEDSRRLLEMVEVWMERQGDEVRIETDMARPFLSWGVSPRVRVDLFVKVPRGSRVNVDSGSGLVEVRDTLGPVDVDSGSGSVTVARAAGPVNVDASSGSVTVEEVQGDVDLDVGSGSITVTRVSGRVAIDGSSGSVSAAEIEGGLAADTGSGSISLCRVAGDIAVNTGSGSVGLHQVRSKSIVVDTGSGGVEADFEVLPAGRYRFDTGSGCITLTVPPQASFVLEAETGSGRIVSDVPLIASHSSRRRLEGVVGDGSARITAETSSGVLTIRTSGPGGHVCGAPKAHCGAGGAFHPAAADPDNSTRSSSNAEHRDAVLRMVAEGKLTAEQARDLLEALGVVSAGDEPGRREFESALREAEAAVEAAAEEEEEEAEMVAEEAEMAAQEAEMAAEEATITPEEAEMRREEAEADREDAADDAAEREGPDGGRRSGGRRSGYEFEGLG